MQYIDMCTWLRGDILLKADRMSMANSLEVRVPFLDPKVFDIAALIPTKLKVPPRSKATKVALRRALVGVVPPELVNRPKWGFPTPIRAWLRKEMYPWAAELLGTSRAGSLLDLPYVRGLLDAHKAGEADNSREVWTVLVFCIWHSIFIEGARHPDLAAGSGNF
jgi:asparagine synthase (glutamine-hydrolysing)